MKKKRVLLMYIRANSGHHQAAWAVEKALKILSPGTEVMNIDFFNYANPIMEKIINKTYEGIIKTTPEVWDYLYDNPQIVKRTRFFRNMVHKYNSGKFKSLLEDFAPDVVACTQAFPCGIVADYKKASSLNLSLIGILTDYAPHSYWIYDEVNYYIVSHDKSKERLMQSGVLQERIKEFGIPVDPAFRKRVNREDVCKKIGLSPNSPILLIMGGSQGMGPVKKMVKVLDKSNKDFQIIVVCGTNRLLYKWLAGRQKKKFRKKTAIFEYVNEINKLMETAGLIITKPGGLTITEAMVKGLPMVIINPIPGQELNNADFLLGIKAAVKADDEQGVRILVEDLLDHPVKLEQMKWAGRSQARPDAAFDIAELILQI